MAAVGTGRHCYPCVQQPLWAPGYVVTLLLTWMSIAGQSKALISEVAVMHFLLSLQ